jgi:hypothetical protein
MASAGKLSASVSSFHLHMLPLGRFKCVVPLFNTPNRYEL